MLIKKPEEIKSSEITDKKVYLNRRLFMRGAVLAATTVATGALYKKLNPPPPVKRPGEKLAVEVQKPAMSEGVPPLVGEKQTSLEDITNYNNFYEFSTDKRSVAEEAAA